MMFDLMIGRFLCKIGFHQWVQSRTGKTRYCTRRVYAPMKVKHPFLTPYGFDVWVCGKEKKK